MRARAGLPTGGGVGRGGGSDAPHVLRAGRQGLSIETYLWWPAFMLLNLVNVLVFESLQPILAIKKIGGGVHHFYKGGFTKRGVGVHPVTSPLPLPGYGPAIREYVRACVRMCDSRYSQWIPSKCTMQSQW